MPGPMGGGMRGPGRRMQGGTRIENPGKVFKRLMAYIFKNYGIHFIFVLVCIVLSVVASIQGTLFMQRLIDDYIMPMIGQETPDFGNLFREIVRVAGFYLVGVAATYAYNRIMVTITQGTLKNLRDDLFEHMEKLPSVLRMQDKLLKKIRPAMLTTIMAKDTQSVETGITPPSAAESSLDRTVRIAMMGIISKTESSRLKTKEAIKFFRCFPEKSNSRLIS